MDLIITYFARFFGENRVFSFYTIFFKVVEHIPKFTISRFYFFTRFSKERIYRIKKELGVLSSRGHYCCMLTMQQCMKYEKRFWSLLSLPSISKKKKR